MGNEGEIYAGWDLRSEGTLGWSNAVDSSSKATIISRGTNLYNLEISSNLRSRI